MELLAKQRSRLRMWKLNCNPFNTVLILSDEKFQMFSSASRNHVIFVTFPFLSKTLSKSSGSWWMKLKVCTQLEDKDNHTTIRVIRSLPDIWYVESAHTLTELCSTLFLFYTLYARMLYLEELHIYMELCTVLRKPHTTHVTRVFLNPMENCWLQRWLFKMNKK